MITMHAPTPRQSGEQTWLLMGGIGAVPAVERFFRALSADAAGSCAFVVAIAAPAAATRLLARLLGRLTPGAVQVAGLERGLSPGDVLVLPAEANPPDRVLCALADRYGERLGVIVLSGIESQTGIEGCRNLSRAGGRLWVQNAGSARCTALPESISRACEVALSASPEGLATALGGMVRPPPAPLPFARRDSAATRPESRPGA
jgi:chemotaxis response regulator CheB